jgi:hypothetical protein
LGYAFAEGVVVTHDVKASQAVIEIVEETYGVPVQLNVALK